MFSASSSKQEAAQKIAHRAQTLSAPLREMPSVVHVSILNQSLFHEHREDSR